VFPKMVAGEIFASGFATGNGGDFFFCLLDLNR
jgi:hypothetical protein